MDKKLTTIVRTMELITKAERYLSAENCFWTFIPNIRTAIEPSTIDLHFHTIGAYSSNFYTLGSITGKRTNCCISCSINVQARKYEIWMLGQCRLCNELTDSSVQNAGQHIVDDNYQRHASSPKFSQKIAAQIRVGFFVRDLDASVQDDEAIVIHDASQDNQQYPKIQPEKTHNLQTLIGICILPQGDSVHQLLQFRRTSLEQRILSLLCSVRLCYAETSFFVATPLLSKEGNSQFDIEEDQARHLLCDFSFEESRQSFLSWNFMSLPEISWNKLLIGFQVNF